MFAFSIAYGLIFIVENPLKNHLKERKRRNPSHFEPNLYDKYKSTKCTILYAKKSKTLVIVDVHVLPNSFQITVVKNQQLELYNTFNYQTSEDFIYYLLFVLNQLNIKNDETTIRLTGEVDKNSAIYDMLFKYINTIEFCELPNDLNYSYVFEQTQKHYHYSLFNLYLCE